MHQYDDKPNRISNASTADNIDDDRYQMALDENKVLSCDPHQNLHLFTSLQLDQKKKYEELETSLQSIYLNLTREIEPVCIRESCTYQGKSIDLNRVSSACITRRRVSVLNQQ
jgi:hypothetical protein